MIKEEEIFKVKTDAFEGPLDLLLSLIEKRKLLINDISLAKVADDYIAYVRQLTEFPIGMSAHFILIASTLLLLKSKSLLPGLALSEEEEGNIEDLERRLKLYKRIRDLSHHIRENFGEHFIFLPEQRKIVTVFSPHASITINNLAASIKGLLVNLPKQSFLPKAVVDKVISLEEMIGNLTKRIQTSLRMSFGEFAKVDKKDKINIIVSFLAMLELVKQGIITVKQENHFDEIIMETEKLEVPKYA
jgi:segregation and condensation protein A